jgi:predicted ATPase
LPPEELRRRQLAALNNWVMAGARAQSIVLALEDIHWADPTTLDVLRGIAERGALAPLFVLMTARPEFRPPWGMRSHHGMIALAPLDPQQVRQMVGELAARHALPKEVIDGVTDRAGGVPLFVEEVTRLLLERGELGGIQAIPPTLQQSLTARLDRLGSAREVAQVGAVIGRDFSYPLLHTVAEMEGTPLQTALERLAEADILLVQGVPPDADYRFKHALIQDSAYENLLKSRRQILHRRVGEVLRDQFPVRAASEPELLAHHFTQAGLTEVAVEWWGKAVERSLERSALAEAGEQFTRALAQIASLPPTSALRRQQIKFQVGLTNVLMHTKGRAAPETKASVDLAWSLIETAEALGEPLDDPLTRFSVLYGKWNANYVEFNGDALHQLSMQILTQAKRQGTTIPLMIGHRLMGMSLLHTGELAEARTHFDRANIHYDPAAHGALATRFGQDIRAAILSYRSLTWWLLGYPKAAVADAEQALSHAREIGPAITIMSALGVTAMTYIACRNYATASALLDELSVLIDERGAFFWKGNEMSFRGWLLALTRRPVDSVHMITTGMNAKRSIGSMVYVPFDLSYLAKAYADLGQFDDARRCIVEAVTAMETTKETLYVAEVNRMAGEIAATETDAAKAEAYFERALAVARQQQAKSWELRAAMSMTRLWRDQGKRNEGRELLAPIYGWFTEGFDTRDLKEAKALLDELTA